MTPSPRLIGWDDWPHRLDICEGCEYYQKVRAGSTGTRRAGVRGSYGGQLTAVLIVVSAMVNVFLVVAVIWYWYVG